MLARIPLFFLMIQGISVFLHLALYLSVIRFFAVASTGARVVLAVVFFLLSFTFFSSLLLVRSYDSHLTDLFYAVSALWAGVMINLILASALGWAFLAACRIAGYRVRMTVFAAFFYSAALFYSAYGVWNAFHPVIKNIEVRVKGLPEAWKGKTVVQISDLHLGVINRAGFLKDVVEQVNSLKPRAVFITGDLFDGMDGDLDSFVAPLNAIDSEKGVFFVTGNHENFLGLDRVFSTLAKTSVQVLDDRTVRIDGLQIIGVSYPQPGRKRNASKAIRESKGFISGMPGVLLYHLPASIDQVSENPADQRVNTYFSPLIDFTAARDLGALLQLSGHTHGGQLFPFEFLTARLYKGYDYGLHALGDFSVYTTCGTGTWGPPMRTANTPEIVALRLD